MMLGFLTYLYRFFLLWSILILGTIWCGIVLDHICEVPGLVIILVLELGPILMCLYMFYLGNKPHKPRIHIWPIWFLFQPFSHCFDPSYWIGDCSVIWIPEIWVRKLFFIPPFCFFFLFYLLLFPRYVPAQPLMLICPCHYERVAFLNLNKCLFKIDFYDERLWYTSIDLT